MTTTIPAIMLNKTFYEDPSNRKFFLKHGMESIVIIQVVWTAISQNKKIRIRKDEVEFLSYPPFPQITQKKIREVLQAATSKDVKLLEDDEEFYYNSQVSEKVEKFNQKRKIYQENANKRWSKSDKKGEERVSNSNAIALPIESAKENDLVSKSNLPLPLYLDNNKEIVAAELELPKEINGRIQCPEGKYVYLSEYERDLVRMEYSRLKIPDSILSDVIYELSSNIEKNKNHHTSSEYYLNLGREDAFRMLTKGWPKDSAVEKQNKLVILENSQKVSGKINYSAGIQKEKEWIKKKEELKRVPSDSRVSGLIQKALRTA